MRAINHALTGAIIGLSIEQPAIALPLAFASHYVLDAIPHFDLYGDRTNRWLKQKSFRVLLGVDALLCAALVAILVVSKPHNWLVAIMCAFLGALPDAFSFLRYKHVNDGQVHHANRYERFASKIQWFERPIGWVVEVAWFIGAIIVLVPLVH